MAAQLILGLSILVILHELGHFIAARAFGIRVEKFYLFFDAWGYKLFSFKFKGTEYGIGWLPLGGYVKIAGMIDESMDKDQMAQPPKPDEFRSKPAWQRLIVMIGGVTVNILLGIFIFWMLTLKNGESYIPNSEVKHGIVAHSLAREIGLQTGDRILAVNGEPVERFDEVMRGSKVLLGDADLSVERGDQKLTVPVPSDFMERVSEVGIDSFISPRQTFIVGEVLPGSRAAKAGLQKNDIITAVNDTPVPFFDQFRGILQAHKEDTLNLSVLRNNEPVQLKVEVSDQGMIGFAPEFNDFNLNTIYYGFFESLPVGAKKAWKTLTDNVKGLGKVISGEVAATKAVQGPIGIATIYGGQFEWTKFWTLTAILSMILAFMNILPIPALDGGHTLFLLIEMVKGKPVSDKVMEKAQVVGFVILIALMVFAFGNDIWKIVAK